MNRNRLLALGLAFLAGCPGENAPPPATPVAPVASGTVPATPVASWSEQAERVCARLDEVVKKAEEGDRTGALATWEKAYFADYEAEAPGRNLEVASKKYLPEELFDGRMRNVVQAREDAFGQIKSGARAGAPPERIRSLVAALSAKIRDDAKKLDAMKAPP
jgi:hypothetical protein